MSDSLNSDFLDFIEALNTHQVRYIIVGGYSVVFHGYPRTTGDLDVWVEKTAKNYQQLTEAFLEFQMPVFDMTEDNFLRNRDLDVFTFGRPPVAIEVLNQVKGLKFDSAYTRVEKKIVDRVEILYLSYDDLIRAKIAAGRPRDKDDIENLKKPDKKV